MWSNMLNRPAVTPTRKHHHQNENSSHQHHNINMYNDNDQWQHQSQQRQRRSNNTRVSNNLGRNVNIGTMEHSDDGNNAYAGNNNTKHNNNPVTFLPSGGERLRVGTRMSPVNWPWTAALLAVSLGVNLSGVPWPAAQTATPSAPIAHEVESPDSRVSARELLDLLERRGSEASCPAPSPCECCCGPRFALTGVLGGWLSALALFVGVAFRGLCCCRSAVTRASSAVVGAPTREGPPRRLSGKTKPSGHGGELAHLVTDISEW